MIVKGIREENSGADYTRRMEAKRMVLLSKVSTLFNNPKNKNKILLRYGDSLNVKLIDGMSVDELRDVLDFLE